MNINALLHNRTIDHESVSHPIRVPLSGKLGRFDVTVCRAVFPIWEPCGAFDHPSHDSNGNLCPVNKSRVITRLDLVRVHGNLD